MSSTVGKSSGYFDIAVYFSDYIQSRLLQFQKLGQNFGTFYAALWSQKAEQMWEQ